MTTIDEALTTISRAVYDEQMRAADTLHRLLNTAWIIHNAASNGNREAESALATDWPTMPRPEPQALDDALDDMMLKVPIEPTDTDPETMARIERIAAQFAASLPPPERDR